MKRRIAEKKIDGRSIRTFYETDARRLWPVWRCAGGRDSELVAGRTDDTQRADFQLVAGQLARRSDAVPDVGSQCLHVWRFDKSHGRRPLLEEPAAPAARLRRVVALHVRQAELVPAGADFEAARDRNEGGADARC
jgi:hypothetical protein